MNIEELIVSRRTIHQFNGEVVDQGTVNKALEMALWAPNHKHTHPWVFFDLGPESKNFMADLAIQLKSQKEGRELSGPMQEALRNKLCSCSHMIFVGQKLARSPFQQKEDYATVACGIQNASLFLHSQGVGSKWSTGGFTSHEETYKFLGINKEEVFIVGALLIGKFEAIPQAPDRPNLSDRIKCRP